MVGLDHTVAFPINHDRLVVVGSASFGGGKPDPGGTARDKNAFPHAALNICWRP